ncbi:glycosyltransferase [Streptomyces sp. NP160]|uniref:glycosyltransferase family 2 protein n=1 Tax=Streptomyces sp. NP160 TaxID=2586637 RepID=UPI00111A7084|nr:glycosyltransferase [Streptomyces sp. NP160]TNM61047.1 glycosyltransferase [Streptomyces sp. NP160]
MTRTPAADHPADLVVAVLTYRRTDLLLALLPRLLEQTGALHRRAGVLVVDNDPEAGACAAVEAFAAGAGVGEVVYLHEPRPGIAAARNRALQGAGAAELLVFIDDDEVPEPHWLELLVRTFEEHPGAAGVAGAVVSTFEAPLTPWVVAGGFFVRQRHRTGSPLPAAATNNLLLHMPPVRELGLAFDERFGTSGGSDTLFTRQLTAAGHLLVWCDEAVVVDQVPAQRCTASWVVRRALRSGNSWSRTSLALTAGRAARTATWTRLVARGALRIGAGGARAAAGTLLRSPEHQARGVRTAVRGAGMVAGAVGGTYAEYRR